MRFDGCFYASGGVRQLKTKGKPWQGYLKYKTPDGTWKQVTKMLDSTGKRDAERLLCEWQEDMERRASVAVVKDAKEIKRSVGSSVADEVRAYLEEQYATGLIERSTYSTQLTGLTHHIQPYFADIRFEDLTRAQVRAWVALQLESYGERTVDKWVQQIAKTYAHAITEDRIAYNPCEHVRVKKQGTNHNVNALACEDVPGFVEAVRCSGMSERTRCSTLLALYTGMRVGEISALRWMDVNFPTATITVKQALGRDKLQKTDYIKTPKSKAGQRVIPILPEAEEALRDMYNSQLTEYQALHPGAKELPRDYFCTGKDAGKTPYSPTIVSSNLRTFARINGFVTVTGKPVSPHALRHTFATMGVASHMDVKSLSSILGHAKASMTLDVYARADEQAVRQGMMQLGNYLKEQERTGGFSDFQ